MPRRARTRALFPVALSASAAADALSVPLRKVQRAIDNGELEAFDAGGNRVRILVSGPGGLVEWVRTWWPQAKRRKS